MRVAALALLSVAAVPVLAADLRQDTVAAFDRYARATERRLATGPFLWFEAGPEAQRRAAGDALRRGELLIEPVKTSDNGKEIEIPDGIVHHWVGVVFAKGVTLDRAVALLQDYDRHATIYSPNVAGSKLIRRDGDQFTVFLRFFMKKVITVVVDSEHDARFTRHGADRVSSRIVSTRITQVEDPGTPKERTLPVGHDGGYLWRLNSYWRFEQRDGGVYIQCESITLTRQIPFFARMIVRPFVNDIPRETLTFTLDSTRKTLASGGAGVAARSDR
jgi:hypothetical protein